MKKNRILSLLLALLLTSSVLVSCSDKGSNEESQTIAPQPDAAASEESTAETIDDTIRDDLPEINYDGAAFGMLTFENQNFNYQMLSEETLGEPLNDAIFNSTLKVEDRFNIDMQQLLYNDGQANARIFVTSGDQTVDLIRIRCDGAVSWWSDGLLVPSDEVPVINLEKPYWDKTINDSLSIAGKRYTALSAFDLCTYDLTFALMFNKDFITDFNLENPYEIVTNGAWTMDKMNEMMLTVVNDQDGNGIWDSNDRYGYLSHPKMAAPGFWIGGGVKAIEKNENDIPSLNIGSERFIGVWEKLLSITHGQHQYFGSNEAPDIPVLTRQMFSENKALFMDMSFFFAEALRSMESDFGIIPYPKYEEAQADYCARLCYYMPTIVPITKVDAELERCGVMLEALACEYFNEVVPAYYDVVLQYKVARDEESQGMLDIIFSSRVVDIGDSTMCGQLRDGILRTMFEANFVNISAKAASLGKIINSQLEELPGVAERLE